jgi:hypothetical protein
MISSVGRKAIGAGVITGVGVGVAVGLGDIPPNLLTLLVTVFTGYVLGNVGSKALGVFQASRSTTTTTVDNSALEAKIDTVQETAANAAQGVSALIAWVQQNTTKRQ